jgi:2-oxoisovalerate dehydrogenase E1 component
MRKHMTRVIAEVMEKDPKVVYIGEDVEHGGYYLVTDGLVKRFKGRVIDFPPDETTLIGAAMGFSQVGLLPIIEIPYAKYLDCGADMFYELAISNWLTNKQRPNGMVIRIQGFDRGRESILFALYYTVQQRSTFFLFSFRRKLPYAQHDITRSSGGGCGVL